MYKLIDSDTDNLADTWRVEISCTTSSGVAHIGVYGDSHGSRKWGINREGGPLPRAGMYNLNIV